MSPNAKTTADPQLSEFLLRVCHDLRAPLRAVRTNAELLARRSDSSAAQGENLSYILEGAIALESLVSALSQYSLAMQIDESTFHPSPLDVLVRTVLAKLDPEIRKNEATVTCAKLPRVTGNPDRLMEVFHHLISNALRHRGAAAPEVELTATEQADAWQFAVRDNGPGIEARYLETIFAPFQRLDRQPGAAGLGLATCRRIVESHGGTIWAESVPGEGATFIFTLPKQPAAV
jgi:signal transduction histidine kinase